MSPQKVAGNSFHSYHSFSVDCDGKVVSKEIELNGYYRLLFPRKLEQKLSVSLTVGFAVCRPDQSALF